MPDKDQSYVDSRIERALEEAGGNPSKAQRLLLSWVNTDDELLRGLAVPHLKSIVGYALQQAIFEEIEEDIPVEKPSVTVQPDDAGGGLEIGAFGMELLHNMTGGKTAQKFGFVTDEIDAPKKTSQNHIDAILQLAKKKE